MTTGAAFKQGFGLTGKSRSAAWMLFWVNLALAALAGLPIYRGILRFTGHSLLSQTLRYSFSTDWLTDFRMNSPGSFDRYAAMVSLFALLSIPVNTVLAGGVLAHFRSTGQKFFLGDFCRDSLRYAWRLIRLMIVGLICYWIFFRVLNQGLSSKVGDWTRNWTSDRSVFWLHLVVGVLVLVGLAFVSLVMDYARVHLILNDSPSAAEAFLASLGFSVRRLGRALTVYALPSLAGIALLGLYWLAFPSLRSIVMFGVHAVLGRWPRIHEPLTLALLFIGQQAVVFVRYWLRVATWAGEWSYYSGSR